MKITKQYTESKIESIFREAAAEYADEMTKDYEPKDRNGFGIVIKWNEYYWSKYDELKKYDESVKKSLTD